MNAHEIIISPIITEKSTTLSEEQGKYAFMVPLRANKVEIRKAVERLFKVHVRSVNTMRMHGKKKRVRFRQGMTSDWKKAIVTLQEGQRLDVFEGV